MVIYILSLKHQMTVNFLQSLRRTPTHTPQNKHTLLYSEVILGMRILSLSQTKKRVRMAHNKQEKRRRRKRGRRRRRRRRKKRKARQW